MAKKHKHPEHENLERWLVSYADFITLLFAVFVVLYALSQLDLAKFKDLKISLSKAFAPTIFAGQGSESAMMDKSGEKVLNEDRKGDEVNILEDFNPQLEIKKMEQAESELKEAIQKGDLKGVSAKLDKRGLVISLVDSVFFNSGSAQVKDEANKMLDKVALTIKRDFSGNKIRVEGHTDSDPISTSVYPSNWELSGSRASSVVRHFIKRFKMPKETFSAVGYADAIPLASNSTNDGKRKNRRVEIVILNSKTSELESGGSENTPTSNTETETNAEPADNNIIIIKGSKSNEIKNDNLNPIEEEVDEQTTQILEEGPSETTTNTGNYKPIDMPVKPMEDSTNSKPYEIMDIETTKHN